MKEVFVSFEEQGLEGIVAVDTYLMDAALRIGVPIDDGCRHGEDGHRCSVIVGEGSDLLSEPTKSELEVLTRKELKDGKRLACQAKVVKAGEVKIMSVEKTEEEKKAEEVPGTEEEFKKEFEAMPLDQKYANLLELEAMALGETFAYVINSPYEAFGKAMGVLADFGWKKDRADHEAKKPEEHSETPKKEPEESSNGKAEAEASGGAKKASRKSSKKEGKKD